MEESFKELHTVLSNIFPDCQVEIFSGWFKNRCHVKLTSPIFKGKNEAEMQDMIWGALPKDVAKQYGISLILGWSNPECNDD